MKRRILKLGASLWPMLLVVLASFCIFGVPFSIKSAVLNFFLLGWFGKLPGFGHLWFVTMIVLCYLLFVGLSHVKKPIKKWWLLPAFAMTTFCAYITYRQGLPGYLFLILLYCGGLFLYGASLLKWTLSVSGRLLTGMTVGANGIVLFLFYKGWLHSGSLVMYYATALCGILLLMWLYRMFTSHTPGAALVYVSGISYEIYLVHHPFCFGQFSLFQYTGSYWWLGILLIGIVTLLLAISLNRIAKVL